MVSRSDRIMHGIAAAIGVLFVVLIVFGPGDGQTDVQTMAQDPKDGPLFYKSLLFIAAMCAVWFGISTWKDRIIQPFLAVLAFVFLSTAVTLLASMGYNLSHCYTC